MGKKRVVITGMGVVSSQGIGINEWWKNLLEGTSRIKYIKWLEMGSIKPIGAEISQFDFNLLFDKADVYKEYLDRGMKFGFVAAKEAYDNSGLDKARDFFSDDRFGVYVGTTTGGIVSAFNEASKYLKTGEFMAINPNIIYSFPPASWSNIMAHYFRANGITKSVGTSCYAGGESLGNCYRDIKDGYIDVAIAGGLDAPIVITNYLSFHIIGATSSWKGNPEEACRPFSRDRTGMVFGEGAAFFVLEDLELALKRRARIYAEIVGYSATTDGDHMVHPSEDGTRWFDAIKQALEESCVSSEMIDYVSCHGTGTYANDRAEVRAIKAALGDNYKNVCIGSIKSMIGHAFGGATAIEIAAIVKILETKFVPPTINFTEFDPECDMDCVPNICRKVPKCECVLKTATGFGGSNMAMILKSWRGGQFNG